MRGEVYCSTRCAREGERHPFWRTLRDPLARPVSAWLAVAAVALAGAGPLVLALRTVEELERLNEPGPFPTLRRPAETARIDEVVETPSGIRLSGRAKGGFAVFLYAGGRLVASAFADGGRFRFEGVRETGPYRVSSMPAGARAAEAAAPPATRIAESRPRPAAAAPIPVPVPAASGPSPAASAVARPTAVVRRAAPSPTAEVRLAIRFSHPTEPPAAAAPPRPPVVRSTPAPTASGPPAQAQEALPAEPAGPPPPAPPAAAGLLAPDLTRGPSDRREILVSFDAGSSDRGAAQILDALSQRGIRTTVFLTGEFIRRYPELVRRVAADGHEVGNHTDTHPHLTTFAADGRQATRKGVDRAFLAGELARTARLYREITGRAMAPLWRAPFGEHNAEIRRWAAEQGYWHVGWTGGRGGLDGLDWISDPGARGYQSADALLRRLVRRAENGGIVLLHLGSDRSEPVAERIDVLLDGLRERRYEFARASDFLARQGWDAERLTSFRPASASATR